MEMVDPTDWASNSAGNNRDGARACMYRDSGVQKWLFWFCLLSSAVRCGMVVLMAWRSAFAIGMLVFVLRVLAFGPVLYTRQSEEYDEFLDSP
jgi:hypothetical protein